MNLGETQTFILLHPVRPFWTSGLWACKIIDFCCYSSKNKLMHVVTVGSILSCLLNGNMRAFLFGFTILGRNLKHYYFPWVIMAYILLQMLRTSGIGATCTSWISIGKIRMLQNYLGSLLQERDGAIC